MSEMKKAIVNTPIGDVRWFSLTKADKFGNFTCELHLDESEDSLRFIESLENFGKGKKPYEKTDSGYKVKLKSKSQGTKRDGSTYIINPPALYNAVGQRLQGAELEALNIGNGSQIRAKIEVKQYNFAGQDGVSIKVMSAQIVKAMAYSGGNQDLGFEALEVNLESKEEESSSEESGDYDF